MNLNALEANQRTCLYCNGEKGLRYYKEEDEGRDLYYCEDCYGIVAWDGRFKLERSGEAYPNRDKPQHGAESRCPIEFCPECEKLDNQ